LLICLLGIPGIGTIGVILFLSIKTPLETIGVLSIGLVYLGTLGTILLIEGGINGGEFDCEILLIIVFEIGLPCGTELLCNAELFVGIN
jgi:hypothetical protein